MNKFRAAAIQMPTVEDKMENIKAVRHYLEQIKAQKVDFVVLPEMFCCPYQTEKFPEYAEEEGGSVWKALSAYAKEYNIYLVAGSVPEKDDEGHVYNTCYIFDRNGIQIGKHRKTHLFDIDVKGGQSFKESDTLTAGNNGTVFDTEFGRMGVMICFDIRFPEFARMMVNDGAKMIFVPAAFNMTTGPAHWELLSAPVHWTTRFICWDVHRHVTRKQDIFHGDIPYLQIHGEESWTCSMKKKGF